MVNLLVFFFSLILVSTRISMVEIGDNLPHLASVLTEQCTHTNV